MEVESVSKHKVAELVKKLLQRQAASKIVDSGYMAKEGKYYYQGVENKQPLFSNTLCPYLVLAFDLLLANIREGLCSGYRSKEG